MDHNIEKNGPLLIMGAMNSETNLLIASLEQCETLFVGDFGFYSGLIGNKAVIVCRCLIGTVYSSAAVMLGIERFSPRAVITCGTAGAHNPELHRGDIVLGENMINAGRYNTPHKEKNTGSSSLFWEFPKEECFEIGGYVNTYSVHSDEQLIRSAETTEYDGGRIIRGTVITSDAWNRELDRILFFNSQLGSDCEDMESFAVAKLCEQFKIPCISIRIISNSEFFRDEECDFELFGKKCQEFVLELIKKI